MRSLMLATIVLVLAACSDPTFDGSSEDNAKASVKTMREALPESKRAEFDQALALVAMSTVDMKALFTGKQTAQDIEAQATQKLQGKSALEIIEQAKAIETARNAREREQALAEIQELKEKQLKANVAKAQLAKFQVTRSRFRLEEQRYMGPKAIIELSVVNNTETAVARAYFKGTIASPGRSIPWITDEFNYSIAGGLESGEKASWNLEPNMFSGWGKARPPSDAVFTVEAYRLDGADGEPLFDANGFDKEDEKRLAALLKEHS